VRRTLRAIAVSMLAGAILAGLLSIPASAANSDPRYYQHPRGKLVAAPYRYFRCNGRYYTYGGGWGCDHYVYSYDWPLGRR
jgi:hypothetical protein